MRNARKKRRIGTSNPEEWRSAIVEIVKDTGADRLQLTTPTATSSGDSSSNYVYDVENRLVSATGEQSAALVYDPLGRLAQVNGSAGVTRFHYDGDELIAEYDFAGNLLRRYVHGPGADEPVAVYEGVALGLASRRYMLPTNAARSPP